MRSCGIVTEYNPFHNGHRYHIEQARRVSGCDALLAVMSGNFVQRGECAIVDKWTRAKAAIQAGCDLVIELPTPMLCSVRTSSQGRQWRCYSWPASIRWSSAVKQLTCSSFTGWRIPLTSTIRSREKRYFYG